MRPIKFRAWDTAMSFMYPAMSLKELSEYAYLYDGRDHMQYIGRKDKNGVEIYEGDVLKNDQYDKSRVWVVEYRTDSEYVGFVKVCKTDHAAGLASTFMSWEGCEVIGNIYQNPDLLDEAA